MIEREDRGAVRVLALHRAPVNALDLTLTRAIREAIAAARDDTACRALVLTGAPGVFSAGIDTRAVPAYDAASPVERGGEAPRGHVVGAHRAPFRAALGALYRRELTECPEQVLQLRQVPMMRHGARAQAH